MWFFIKNMVQTLHQAESMTEGVIIECKNTVVFDDFMVNTMSNKKLYLKNTN